MSRHVNRVWSQAREDCESLVRGQLREICGRERNSDSTSVKQRGTEIMLVFQRMRMRMRLRSLRTGITLRISITGRREMAWDDVWDLEWRTRMFAGVQKDPKSFFWTLFQSAGFFFLSTEIPAWNSARKSMKMSLFWAARVLKMISVLCVHSIPVIWA